MAQARKAPLSASIKLKLVALTAILIASIVTGLTLYLLRQRVAELQAEQLARVSTYGELLSRQTRSAVAFVDRETAREVLASLDADPDVVAVSLFIDNGEALYRRGVAASWIERARAGVTETRVIRTADRFAVVAPVQSLEGPRGTLVIEISNDRMNQHLYKLMSSSLLAVGIAIGIGALLSWLIARSLARRLRSIVDIATNVSEDAQTDQMVVVDSRDEIGVLANAFNQMLVRLRGEQARLTRTVSDLTCAEEQLAVTNRELEARVGERTEALQTANGHLQLEMAQRSKMELELRQAQKLESVGRLASGIAHEINTPVQFVTDSATFLQLANRDLFAVILGYRDALREVDATTSTIGEAIARTQHLEEEHEVTYLEEQVPLAITRALQGLGRISEIVRAMKDFAFPDRSTQTLADLNRAILSTLTVAHNEYKFVAEVKTELGDLPQVMCHIGELNQVVLNMVVNSAHAIAQAPRDGEFGQITIRTEPQNDNVVITIEDNGSGIPQDVIDKIFDPFFTTKEMGRGTGQGLAIARAVIVDKHHGSIDVRSELGRGTTFVIRLPVGGTMTEPVALAS
ncbi:hypothetical protein BH11MYX1_BH11MYX1_18750 [soil metagenome]